MKAGLLTEIIDIYSPTIVINDYGERTETLEKTYTTRAKVNWDSGNRVLSNEEIYYDYSKTFNVRYYVPVKETDQIEWQNKRYRIITIEKRKEYNDILIKTTLINE